MEDTPDSVSKNSNRKKRQGPTKGEYQLLFVVATALVLIVGGYIAFAFVFGHAWGEAHRRGDEMMRELDPPR